MAGEAFAKSGTSADATLYAPDTPGESHAGLDLRVPGPNPDCWLFAICQIDQSLPHWLQFGSQFRDRAEGLEGLSYGKVDDNHDLTQLRIGFYVQPANWLGLAAVTQDSRVFFNHHVATAPPYQNIWDIREAYLRLGNANEGWIDFVVGREIFSFGDERVIGPSDWLNMGRTFDTVRVDLHPPGVKVSIFAASVINAIDGQIDHISKKIIFTEFTAASRISSRTPRSSPICCGGWRPRTCPFRKPNTTAFQRDHRRGAHCRHNMESGRLRH